MSVICSSVEISLWRGDGLGIDSMAMERQRRSSSERYDDGSSEEVVRQERYGEATHVDADEEDDDERRMGVDVGGGGCDCEVCDEEEEVRDIG